MLSSNAIDNNIFWPDFDASDIFGNSDHFHDGLDEYLPSVPSYPPTTIFTSNPFTSTPSYSEAPFPRTVALPAVCFPQMAPVESRYGFSSHTMAPPPPGHGVDPFYGLTQPAATATAGSLTYDQDAATYPSGYEVQVQPVNRAQQPSPVGGGVDAQASAGQSSLSIFEFIVVSSEEGESADADAEGEPEMLGVGIKEEVDSVRGVSTASEAVDSEMELETIPNTPDLSASGLRASSHTGVSIPYSSSTSSSPGPFTGTIQDSSEAEADDDDSDDDYVEEPRFIQRSTVSQVSAFVESLFCS